jgi:flap endonuclease-1
MGPRGLNAFLRTNNPNGIKEVGLASFSGKTIVIDASIYLYRFNTNNELIENLYIMITMLKKHNITPLFIFDGKPPPEKYESLNNRRKERDNAEKLYNILTVNNSNSDVSKLLLEKLKRKKTKVNSQNRQETKHLLEVCGISYIEAEGEADELCAYCVLNNIADACLSDDMDLFIYGCPRILRYFSMMKQTVVYYDLDKILNALNLPQNVFTTITILSGTDYNNQVMLIDSLYSEYIQNNNRFMQRMNVLLSNNEHIQNIKKYYEITDQKFNDVISTRKYFKYNKQKERVFLSSYHFIFIE